jgi:hypothetical protein
MNQLSLKKITSSDLPSTAFVVGQMIYCSDTKKVYYDNTDGSRYNGLEDHLIIYDTYSEFTSSTLRYMNKVYIDLSTSLFYKFNFSSVAFENVYTDTDFFTIISVAVAMEGVLLQDIQSGNYVIPKTTSSNVYSALDGTTRLDEILSEDLYITNTAGAYVEAKYDNQRVFKIPFPVAKYSLYRDHMMVSRVVSGKIELMAPITYKINNGNLVINDDQSGVPYGDRLLFMFYYTRTTNMNASQIVDTDNIMDGAVTLNKLDPNMEIPISMIAQSNEAQTVNASEKALIQSMANYTVTSVDANIVIENTSRKFVTEAMYNLLTSLETNGTTTTVVSYVHPATHPASMIILRDLNEDLEQYSRTLETRWANTKVLYTSDVASKINIDTMLTPGNYTIKLTDITNVPVSGNAKLEIETSNGLVYNALEGEWITQRIIFNSSTDVIRVFYRSCSNATYTFSAWTELLSSSTSASSLATTSKDIVGAINEVFQFANDGRTKWLNVIGYPLDKYDTFNNLYAKTTQIKQNLVDALVSEGITCTINDTLQTLVGYVKNAIDTAAPKTGTISSSSTTMAFTDGTNTFNSYYIEITNLFITIGCVNIYKNGVLYASINTTGNGIYDIGNTNKVFALSTNGAYLTTGFRIPVDSASTSYSYYAVPK